MNELACSFRSYLSVSLADMRFNDFSVDVHVDALIEFIAALNF